MTDRRKRVIFLLVLAGALALILWITLFSRFGCDVRVFYSPFWSYREIANGNVQLLFENLENVLLFIPVGLLATWILQLNLPLAVLFSFAASLLIECSQWLFWLGSFEVDDLLHNTLGGLLAAVLVKYTDFGRQMQHVFKKKDLLVIVILVAAFLSVPLCCQWAHTQSMKRLAALNDQANGAVNLLVLDGKDGTVEETDVCVSYLNDGSVRIDGTSKNRAWFLLGKATLPKGTYRFSGGLDASNQSFDLELERLDKDQCNFIGLIRVDSGQDAEFSLESETRIRVLIGVFPGAKGTVLCRPAIYRED